jgi:outer membrane protein assembly factor BamC
MMCLKNLVLTMPLTLLAGCSFLFGEDGLFPDNSEQYKNAPELAQITVPPRLEGAKSEPIYPIPNVRNAGALTSEFEVPRPAPLTAGAEYDAVRIQSLGDESWALVAVAPGQLWPQVRAFLTASGIGVAASDAQAGLIDTQFVTLKDRALPARFRFRVEAGVQRNTAELHVLQQDQAVTDEAWPVASNDLELEKNMLRNVAQFIANSADSAPVSMMADRAMGDSGRITLEDTQDYTRLRLRLGFARAWASVTKGLPDSGFTIDDRDRSAGLFYVTFAGPQSEVEEGWFDWLWGGEEDHPLAGQRYQVKLSTQTDDEVVITLMGSDGAAIARRDQQALLTILKGNIS